MHKKPSFTTVHHVQGMSLCWSVASVTVTREKEKRPILFNSREWHSILLNSARD